MVALGTISINHTLKGIIQNPRPFVKDGTYEENWAIEGEAAEELAIDYGTPSGHTITSIDYLAS
ncbi:MAG: hypothetical protein IH840_02785 [Candidatus Heimdallarchaeota archaeon]|nr:hypothetical protein [Candidatus Heimdallarchaeota archaeon]